MKKSWIWILLLIIVVLIGVSYALGWLFPLNKFFKNQTPDKSCTMDSDCKYFIIPVDNVYCTFDDACSLINLNDSRIIGVNKNWNPICPFPKSSSFQITQCIGGIEFPENYTNDLKCINNNCEKTLS